MAPMPTVWFNPSSSDWRAIEGILAELGVEASYVDYIREPPTVAELGRILVMLGTRDPRTIARMSDALWADLGLDARPDEWVLAALHEHPALIQQPIVFMGERAVIARPPERVLELLDAGWTGRRCATSSSRARHGRIGATRQGTTDP